jgi:hypothetical protein
LISKLFSIVVEVVDVLVGSADSVTGSGSGIGSGDGSGAASGTGSGEGSWLYVGVASISTGIKCYKLRKLATTRK